MMILSYLKIAGLVALLAVGGFYVWNYNHLKAKVAAQQIEIENLQLTQKVLDEKAKVFEDFMKKRSQIKRRVRDEEDKTDQAVSSGDVNNVIQLFHGLQQGGEKASPPNSGREGSAGTPTGRKAAP
jgi:hypothetical protein